MKCLKISRSQIDLSKTLMMGQAFRWIQTKPNVFRGVIGDTLYHLEQTTDDEIFYRTFIGQQPATLENLEEKSEEQLVDYLGLNEKYEMPSDEHFLSVMSLNGSGIRLLKQPVVETLFAFICSSNNNIKRISSMVTYLSTKGDLIHEDENGNQYHQFPTIEALCSITEDELRKQSFGYRAKYIVASANYIKEQGGEKWLNSISKLNYIQCMESILTLTGVGQKVADCIMLHSMGYREAVPLDVHVIRIANRDYKLGSQEKGLTKKTYHEVADKLRTIWGSDAGWVQAVLFYNEVQMSKKRPKSTKTERKSPKNGQKSSKKGQKLSENGEKMTVKKETAKKVKQIKKE